MFPHGTSRSLYPSHTKNSREQQQQNNRRNKKKKTNNRKNQNINDIKNIEKENPHLGKTQVNNLHTFRDIVLCFQCGCDLYKYNLLVSSSALFGTQHSKFNNTQPYKTSLAY